MTVLYILLAVAAVVVLYIIVTYNGLVRHRVRVSGAWSDIDVQMKRRYDLVPNLIETVKGYAAHEADTLEAVIQARNAAAANHGTPGEQAESENQFVGALKSLFALSEAYPDLKANESFTDLQQQLSELEDTVQSARRYYNATVRDNNTAIDQFPGNLVASRFGFSRAEFFELDEGDAAARQPVAVKFD